MEYILLAEDETTMRKIMSTYLRKCGYGVDDVEDGKAAWERLSERQDYALVITDRQMPNMDGLELAKRMKNNPKLRSIPILMQTAANQSDEVMEGINAGVYYYLTKPYEEATLITLVNAGIRERRQSEWFEQRILKQQEALGNFVRGEFNIKTPEEAKNVSFLLGSIFPNPKLAISGLYELLLNAVEHGNLNIGYDTKAKLIATSGWEAEINKRLQLPENTNKKVNVQFAQHEKKLEVTITDEGEGFDWHPYLHIEPSRATQANGRGIAKANMLSFDQLNYTGTGNKVHVITKVN